MFSTGRPILIISVIISLKIVRGSGKDFGTPSKIVTLTTLYQPTNDSLGAGEITLPITKTHIG